MSAVISPIDALTAAPLPGTVKPTADPAPAQDAPTGTSPYPLVGKDREAVLNRRLVRLDLRIRSQFDLITSRTGWLLTSHAFMLAAMGATLNANVVASLPTYGWMRTFLLLALPALGLLTSTLVWRSVRAAYHIVDDLKADRKTLLKICNTEFEYELTDLKPADVEAGDMPPKVFPCVLGFIWSVLLVLSILG